jgi:hypothetical protein
MKPTLGWLPLKNHHFLFFGSLLLLNGLLLPASHAQTSLPKERENFVSGVQLLDDFINRFNQSKDLFKNVIQLGEHDSSGTPEQYRTMVYGQDSINRKQAIYQLIDRESAKKIGEELIKKFAVQITSPDKPVMLDFYGENWYAEVIARVKHQGVPNRIALFMTNRSPRKGVSFWELSGCDAPFLNLKGNQTSRKGINAGSHEIGFINLKQAFDDQGNFSNMVAPSRKTDQLSILQYAVQVGNVEFLGVEKVRYHFLQVPGWLFTVEHFPRNDANSGWLISELLEADDEVKSAYKETILNVRD